MNAAPKTKCFMLIVTWLGNLLHICASIKEVSEALFLRFFEGSRGGGLSLMHTGCD